MAIVSERSVIHFVAPHVVSSAPHFDGHSIDFVHMDIEFLRMFLNESEKLKNIPTKPNLFA